MRVQVLGPLRVAIGDSVHEPAGPLQRQLLGLLVAAGTRPMSADLLMDSLWGPDPDEQRGGRLQVHIHRLRKLLDDPERLTFGPLGYTLEVSADEVDAREFEVMTDRALASADPHSCIQGLEAALAVWAGRAYEAISDPLVETEARRLADRRLDALDALAGRYLAAGRIEAAADLVAGPLRDHPWREGLAVARMAALTRLGRQREALEVYRSVREALVSELGIEPGPALQEAQAAVLAGEQITLGGPDVPTAPIPSQLPLPPAVFTGRVAELDRLDAALLPGPSGRGARVTVLSGTAGVGKSALALTWARAHEHEFPDGVVHLDLRGWSADRPVSPATALGRILRSFGVTTSAGEVHEQAAELRSLVRDRKVLFVLDNAATADQVRPLLPSAPGCAALITGRDRLPGLVAHEGAVPIELAPLDDHQAQRLLAEVLGPEMDGDPESLVELAQRCAHLPLALCVAAEYVRSRPVLGLAGLLEELADDGARLDLLDEDAEAGVRTVFGRSYERLDEAAATVFRMLGRLPIADIDLPALAAMTGMELRAARSAVSALMRAHLVFERVGRPGFPRYGTHDLLGSFARELSQAIDGTAAQAALDRLFDHYATGAVRAATALDPGVASEADPHSNAARVELAASGGVPGPALLDEDSASAWLTVEIGSLVAAAAATSPAVDERLCAAAGVMHAYLQSTGTGGRALGRALQAVAIEAATRLGDVHEVAERYNSIAFYEADMWQLEEAREHIAAAVAVMGEDVTDYVRGRAAHNQGVLLSWQAHEHEALVLAHQALAMFRRHAATVDHETVAPGRAVMDGAIANALNSVGASLILLGRLDEAEMPLKQAHDLAKVVDRPFLVGLVDAQLCELALRAGRLDQAMSYAEELVWLVEFEDLGSMEARACNMLGAVLLARGEAHLAVPKHRRALRHALEAGDRTLEVESLCRLAESLLAIGDRDAALTVFREATAKADHPSAVVEHVRALRGLATTYLELGLPSAARDSLEEAIRLCEPNDLDAEPIKAALADL